VGGRSDDPAGLRLLCRGHNRVEAKRLLGDSLVEGALARAKRAREDARRLAKG
jgi:hypothetical protein